LHIFLDHGSKLDLTRTDINTPAATSAANQIEVAFHIIELTQVPISESLIHFGTGRSSTGNFGIAMQLTGIGAPDLYKLFCSSLIIKNNTVTGWTDIGTTAATDTRA